MEKTRIEMRIARSRAAVERCIAGSSLRAVSQPSG
jgi:hypothetical protein